MKVAVVAALDVLTQFSRGGKIMKIKTMALAASVAITGSMAFGATASVVDFTVLNDNNGNPVIGSNSAEYKGSDGTLFTLSTDDGLFNSDGLNTSAAPCSVLECEIDGVGINTDEVTSRPDDLSPFMEMIAISSDTDFDLGAVWVLDLFGPEVALVGDDGGFLIEIPATGGDNPNGLTVVTLENSIRIEAGEVFYFAAKQGNDDDTQTDAALAGFQYTAVPLPAAGWMLLAGLGGLAAMRRRKS